MKKIYQKPAITIIDMKAETPMMAGSITSVKLDSTEAVDEEDEVLAKKSLFNIWGDDEEE